MKSLQSRRHSESGYTLIELLVVMLILGILAAIFLPAFFNEDTKVINAEVCSVSGPEVELPEETGGTYALQEGQNQPIQGSSHRFTVDTTDSTIEKIEPLHGGDKPLRC